jgi:SulP family sulfate permease
MWLWHYRRQDLAGDLLAGVIVAIMLVPQRMAYAMLAGLPPSYLCWPSGWMQASTLPTLGTLKTCFSAP